jgi:hypothetical protein
LSDGQVWSGRGSGAALRRGHEGVHGTIAG